MDIQDFGKQIEAFSPGSPSQKKAKKQLLVALAKNGDFLFSREKEDIHLTAGALVLSPDLSKTLMVHHLIYDSFSWTGGHADGEVDLLSKAIEETKEETGVHTVWCYTPDVLGIYVLPVPAHEKRGKLIPAHDHFVIAYGLIAPEKQKLTIKPDENKAVAWLPVAELEKQCKELHMLPIYRELYEKILAIEMERQARYERLPQALLPWYGAHKRDLPWRRDTNPYHVWVSEIMLQQTRVEAVKAYYTRFMAALPTIADLAQVPEQQLLKLWEGLGYYSRARNLQKAAQVIMAQYGGVFPAEYEEIRALPGIGDYTAGAIASICFGKAKAAVDGNVLRVTARLMADYGPIHLPAVKARRQEDLEKVYPQGYCGDFTQSLMELGATVCVPNGAPKCEICPLADFCLSAGQEMALLLPVKAEKKPRRVERLTVWVLRCGEKVALCQRQEPGLLVGYWQFPNETGDFNEQQALDQAAAWGASPRHLCYATEKKHIFTHIEWHMQGYYIDCEREAAEFTWVTLAELEEHIPLPGAFRIFLAALA